MINNEINASSDYIFMIMSVLTIGWDCCFISKNIPRKTNKSKRVSLNFVTHLNLLINY